MDVNGQEEKQLKNHSSWIPATPLRPIPPKPPVIFTGNHGNPIDQRSWLGSGRFSQDQCFDASSQAEINGGLSLREAVLPAESCIGSERESLGAGAARLNDISFMSLLALADGASATSLAAQGKDNGASSFSIPNSPAVGNTVYCTANNLVSNKNGANPSTNHNSMEEGTQNKLACSHQHVFDHYFAPAARMEDALLRISTSQFAPATPEKAIRVERKNFPEAQNLSTKETADKEVDGENAMSIAGVGNNEVQCEEQTSNSVRDSSIVVSTPLKENHSPDKGGGNDIDLNEKLQQKPRRRKHRPRVITESKPRARKSMIPKADISKESPTGKRKYVRRKPLNKASTEKCEEPVHAKDMESPKADISKETPAGKRKYVRRKPLNKASEEKCEEPVHAKDMESTKKSCRRALNFDIEGQPQCKSPTCKSTFNLESETQLQGISTEGNQPKSTVHLGQGIEIVLGTTETGIAYDLTCSVSQMLKDHIPLQEKQAPSSPLPAKINSPWRETNVRNKEVIYNDREGQVAANITDTMLPTQAHSPPGTSNVSYCSIRTACNEEGNAGASKRKYFKATEPAESSSTNLEGIYSNSVYAYQTRFWVHCPNIHKKKKSEKGQNTTASCTSSSMTMEKQTLSEPTRSENDAKGMSTASEANNWTIAPQEVLAKGKDAGAQQNKLHTLEHIMNSSHIERAIKRRSRGPTQVLDLASLTRNMEFKMHPTTSAREETMVCDGPQVNSHRPHTCTEDLVAESHATMAREKQTTKRNKLPNSTFSITHELQPYQKIPLYNQHQSLGAPMLWQEILPIDAIVERLKDLGINREGSYADHQEQTALIPYGLRKQEHNTIFTYGCRNQERNALVIYRRDGTIVPFEGSFNPIKKRRPRPKVNLDEETNRVWKLLLQDINSEGIDGTDEDKEKWWEEERRVFRGRADSFIARMHLVQGDRRFSQWKGSVVDSVIGVFLTQNVSDHLSSSAFMSMASHFPKKSKDQYKSCHEEGTSSAIEEPSLCILGHKEPLQQNEISNQPISDQHSMTNRESRSNQEKEVANSNESLGSSCSFVCLTNEPKGKNFDSAKSCQEVPYDSAMNRITTEIMGRGTTSQEGLDGTAPNEIHSSQDSTVSFCNSVDYPVDQSAERKESFSESSTEAENMTDKSLNESTSFVELLQMAGSKTRNETYSHQISNENSKECIQPKTAEHDDQRQKVENLDGPRSSLRMLTIPSSSYHLHLVPNSGVFEVDCLELFREGTLSSDISKKNDEHDTTNKSALTAESANQTVNQTIMTAHVPEAPQYTGRHDQSCNNIQEDNKSIIYPKGELINEATLSVELLAQAQNYDNQSRLALPNISEALDVAESTATFDDQINTQQITTEPDMNKRADSTSKELDKKNAANIKAKSRRVGKEIKNDIKWEDLKKLAEASGKKRERTADTMDSVDWEAVRHADVSEIAQTIKERGMNNVLGERIKDFLDRVVREHGNIDLEWLRDVPPDKAKEYLLSIRGLGLKSVECVRLLTLHHLAFPVDTNVGRIAVRLGWVPLQPLPESLQLHLLELYPVLESIQKYLWPRLCKLDQRTLYELHYQMITFGKVFCTKSKPNCNACPMRGECRHFASAFASARLALPGPEEKSMVVATENRTDYQTSSVVTNQEMLHLAQATEQSESKQSSGTLTGVNNCEPIVEEPATPEPECTQDPENDIEDTFCEDPDEIPMIKLNIEEFSQTLQNYMHQNMELQEGDVSKALVALTAEAASIPTPKLKNMSRLRTEHQVYELPDLHPLLEGLEKRQPDDPCSYLLAIWTPGETANSFQPPESKCSLQEYGQLCHDNTCFSCNSTKEANAQIIRGTLLIPCRTAMRGSFPLNGTYFQVNEVFADHDSSLNPIDVPRAWIWNLPRRTVYFGTSIPTIFKGLTTEGIQHCFWRGYVCVRGFDQKTRAPRPLMARLHFPASKLKTGGKADVNDR